MYSYHIGNGQSRLAVKFSGKLIILLTCVITLSACSRGWLPAQGPSREQVLDARANPALNFVQVVDVTDAAARRIISTQRQGLFSDTLGSWALPGYIVGPGDVLEVSIWEAPPATLFRSAVFDPRAGTIPNTVTTLPPQMVASTGTINVPFAGAVPAAGRTPQQVEAEITRRLQGIANGPQVLIRVIQNVTSNVTVVGEVTNSVRMPLTAKGERLLDALASAGGVRQPVDKMTVQVTRGNQVQAMPLGQVIQDPRQNIQLQPGDVITAMHRPLSMTILGAAGRNEEAQFESQGISLAQALARAGGVQDNRADAKGVFIFRFEDPNVFNTGQSMPPMTADGRVPVVYRVDLSDPGTFFVAQNFPIKDKDVLYVANAPAVEFTRFMGLVTTVLYPALSTIGTFR